MKIYDDVLKVATPEVLSKLKSIADARGGSLPLEVANRLAKADLSRIAEKGVVFSSGLAKIVKGAFEVPQQPDTLARLLRRAGQAVSLA